MIARHCIVEGRVQGVGFRFFTERAAGVLGIRGWVRNLDDGSVEIYAAGSDEIMEQFMDRVRTGPAGSRVQRVQVQEVSLEEHSGFSVRG